MKSYDLPNDFASDAKNLCGYRVRMIREQTRKSNRRKMTQTELAAKLQCLGVECDRLAICRIETGLRSVSDIELVALSDALGVSINWLLFGKDDDQHEKS
ncbi:MAG: helix-turn-helix transcriptional regulator [Clostridia bacterium]|nr:helix-turn-helix transcriptional regulator [Clostridia bacterium]